MLDIDYIKMVLEEALDAADDETKSYPYRLGYVEGCINYLLRKLEYTSKQ